MASSGSLSDDGLILITPFMEITSATDIELMFAKRHVFKVMENKTNKNHLITLIAGQHFITLNINWIVDV